MQRIAILLTCHNRKDKTIEALKNVYKSHSLVKSEIDLEIYLTDDGSTDGTSKAVSTNFPKVNILEGSGNLFWAGGMRNSWREAVKGNYDSYLLLNDDTLPYENLFLELNLTNKYCLENFAQRGIYIGSTVDPKTNQISYGGAIITNRFMAKSKRVLPNRQNPLNCDLGNANIMLVSKEVVEKIGILSDDFIHGLADFDYTLMAKKSGLPVLITANYLGECYNDNTSPYINYHTLPLKKRIEILKSPIGLDFNSNLHYMRRNFPLRLPFVFLAGYLKVLFPKFYLWALRSKR